MANHVHITVYCAIIWLILTFYTNNIYPTVISLLLTYLHYVYTVIIDFLVLVGITDITKHRISGMVII